MITSRVLEKAHVDRRVAFKNPKFRPGPELCTKRVRAENVSVFCTELFLKSRLRIANEMIIIQRALSKALD